MNGVTGDAVSRSRFLPGFGKSSISGDEPFDDRNDQLDWIAELLPILATERGGVSDQIPVQTRGQFQRNLHGLVVHDRTKFQLRHFSSPIRFEHKIARDDDADGETGPDRQRRGYVELALDDLLPRLGNAIGGALAQRAHNVALLAGRASLGTNAQNRREQRGFEQITPVVVNAILETGITFRVGAGLALQHDGSTVREDDPVPDEQHTTLTESNAGVILTDEAGALRDEENVSGRAVMDVFRHLSRDLAWEVGTDAGDERGGNDGASLKHVGRRRRPNAIRRDGALVGRLIEEGKLAILCRGRRRQRREAEAGEIRLWNRRHRYCRGRICRPRLRRRK
jgi:hypothetical protein